MNKTLSSLLVCALVCFGSSLALAQNKAGAGNAKTVGANKNANDRTAAGFDFQTGPVPDWVVPAQADESARVAAAPMHYEVIDEQARAENDGATFYNHLVRVVNNASGLGTAAQIQIDFDPSYQKLFFNRLEIWRDGRRIDKLKKKFVQFLKRETRLEYRSYDGRVTASIVLDDVRVGDRIEYAFTIRGINPVFEGKFLHEAWVAAEKGPIKLYQFRLLAPENRTINYRAAPDIKIASTVRNAVRETIFRRTSQAQWQQDASVPESAYLDDLIQVSEYKDWAAVAAWGQHLFSQAAAPSSAVRKLAADIMATARTPAERLERALDFVQKDVRYFGMEFGTSSHRPAPPASVIEQRFGDCKDKVTLLIAILKELDMQAAPTLVSTHFRGDLGMLLPSPLAFDHVIAMVTLDGSKLWLDGTRGYQTGALAQRQSIGLRKGLVLQPGSAELADLPGTDAEERIAVEDIFRVPKLAEDVALESRITYFGETAEFMREAIASQSLAPIEQRLTAEYGRFYPGIRVAAPIKVQEIPGKNALTVTQYFTVPQLWRLSEKKMITGDVTLWNVYEALQHPNDPARKKPMRIQSPGIYRHNAVFEFGEDVYRAPDSSVFDDGSAHFSYHMEYGITPRSARIASEMRLLRDAVTPEEWKSFNEKSVKLQPRFSVNVTVPALTLTQSPKVAAEMTALIDAMKAGKERSATSSLAEDKVRRIALTAQLASGRLNNALRAQTLRSRGTVLDHLALYDAAAKDMEEAIVLAPDDADNYTSAAVNAFLNGKDALAIERVNKALQLAPSETDALVAQTFAQYYSGQYAPAKENLLTLLKNRNNVERSYAAIWLYLVARRIGGEGTDAVKPYLPAAASPPWPYPVLKLMTGQTDYEHAFKAAQENAKDEGQLCELYFYAGEKAMLDGDKRHARELFQKAVDTGVTEFNEYAMAKRRLRLLEAP